MICSPCFPDYMSCLLWTFILVSQVTISGPTKCLKRDEIEERDGNVYFCHDPDLPACCELDKTFTCCEEPWKTAMRSQMWILLVIIVTIVLLLFLCSMARGQVQVFEKDTARQAFSNLKEKIVLKFSRNGQRTNRFDQIRSEATTPT